MEILSLIVVAPLELIYRGLFTLIYGAVKNLGVSLFVLSVLTVTLMIPLERCVKSVVEREKLIEKVLEPQIKAIKSKFHGAEQNEALRRLYKRYRYNPILSVRSALGVLIQIPFLMGAYWMLSSYDALKGVSFGPIADLSLPDGLLWGVNLLPILMTAINLATIVVSRLEKRDAIQALFIALLFLVLLYTAPSALLLYWTMNNVIHCLRAALRRYLPQSDVFGPLREITERFIGKCLTSSTLALFLGITLYVNQGVLLLAISEKRFLYFALAALSVLVLLIYVFFLIKGWRGRCEKRTILDYLVLGFALLIGISFAVGFFALLERAWNPERRMQCEILFAFLIPLGVALYWRLRSCLAFLVKKIIEERRAICEAGFVSGVLLLFLGVIWFPLFTYASDPAFFSDHIPHVLASSRVSLFVACVICFTLLWVIVGKGRLFLALASLFLAISSLTFAFVVTPDYGVIDTFYLQYESALSTNFNRITDVLVYFATPVVLVALIYFGKVRILRSIFVVGLLVAAVASREEVLSAQAILTQKASNLEANVVQNDSRENFAPPEYVKEFYTFSKDKKNVVVVFLDMFTGGNVKEILASNPELRKAYDGFTWYKDVVTHSSSTIFSKPGVLGGEEAAAVWNLNKDREKSLEEKINTIWARFLNQLVDEQFRVRVSEELWLKPGLISPQMKSPEKQIFGFSPLWQGTAHYWQKKKKLNIEVDKVRYSRFWAAIGLFNLAPLSQRVRIYKDASWLRAVKSTDASMSFGRTWIAELDTLPDYSSVANKDEDNRFIFVSSLITHVPWSLDEACLPCKNGGWNESRNLANGGLSQEHLNTERCSLLSVAKWLKWMKDNGVYDNTMVVVVSDHGRGDSSELIALNGGRFYPLSVHGLLMVKNFGEHGELRTDTTHRMACADVPEIILRSVRGTGMADAPWTNPNRVRYHVTGPWSRSMHPKNFYSNVTKWRIGGSVYDLKQWKREGVLP